MIYAWSADGTDPVDHDSVRYHMSNRGTQGVIFVEDNEVVNDLDNAESVTFLANDVSCLTSLCINGGFVSILLQLKKAQVAETFCPLGFFYLLRKLLRNLLIQFNSTR